MSSPKWCFGLYDTFEKAERARRRQRDGSRLWRVCYRLAPRTTHPDKPWALIGFPYYMTEEAEKWDRSKPSS